MKDDSGWWVFIAIICVIASIFIVKMIIEADIPLWLKVWLLS